MDFCGGLFTWGYCVIHQFAKFLDSACSIGPCFTGAVYLLCIMTCCYV